MMYSILLKSVLIFSICLSFSITSSFSLTESVDVFGRVNSSDLILNDIWMEPESPKNGEAVTIHGSLYNGGIIPTGDVSDVVTVGYILNGELVEISVLENVLPGMKNGVEISSQPIFDAIPGNYIITVIVNYHDSLSHLRDNPENNIVQKIFQIGDDAPSIITSKIFQMYDNKIEKQKIKIEGKVNNIFQETLEDKEVIIDIQEVLREKIRTDRNGEFSFEADMAFNNEPVKVTIFLEEKSFLPSTDLQVFPIKIEKEQSVLALEITSDLSEYDLEKYPITAVLFQDSYDNLFAKTSTDNHSEQDVVSGYFFLMTIPANHEYIVEIYMNGRVMDAFQTHFSNNEIINREIFISDSAQVKFRIIDEEGKPQNNVKVENWIYTSVSDEEGFTDWIETIPTFTVNESYVAKAIFPNGEIVWSEPFQINDNEKKVISIIKMSDQK